MAKRLNIDLAFSANTSQAKQAIVELQSALSKIATMNTNMPGMDPTKIKNASAAAKELSIHLNNAFNAQTGNFDLSKLDRSLKTSSTNVTELSTKLLNAGTSGQQAFVKLAQAISAADRPAVSLNSKLNDMLTTLKNTARWQISSSILHGFMGAVQSAYGYAQDLNESLNNIRIVTGQTTEQMAGFAEQANRAAKNLSTTTNEYAKAALIFYQQGDTGSEIAEKSDVVTKMSNVTGQSAEAISSQLTAIWNNFNKAGSESYEHYADILTALGAATASSTDEIAGGLEKFSGIAETIGLSYEYAASALATITAVSRESEDVVGTALKTIFSRIQGLKQGETLEDGTDLNKYSESLMNVGISIKDQNGQLKEMDVILDEMGAKWQTLSKDQQMALAQSVAGVRQYNQLMTLMNNWDYMQENVQVAKNSEGELQKQQKIYEESWEAANNRVRASMEAIYKDLIDDEFFIDITDGFSSMIDSVDAFIDGVGGVKTLLIGIGSIFLSSVANKITPALQNLKHTFSVVFKSAEEQAQLLAEEMNKSINHVLETQNLNKSNTVALENAKQLNEAKAKLQAVEQSLTETEKQRANADLYGIQIQQQEIQTIADKITKLHEEKEAILDVAATEELTAEGRKTYTSGSSELDSYLNSARGDLRRASTDEEVDAAANAVTAARQAQSQYNTIKEEIISSISTIDQTFREMGSSLDLSGPTTQVEQLERAMKEAFGNNLTHIQKNLSQLGDNSEVEFEGIRNQVDLLVSSMPKVVSQSDDVQNALTDVFTAKTKDQLQTALEKIGVALENAKLDAKQFAEILQQINPKRYEELKANLDATGRSADELKERQEQLNNAVNGFNPQHVVSKLESFTKLASGLGAVAMAAQSVRSIFQAWSNDDISFGEKLMSTFIALPMALSSAQRAFTTFNGLFGGLLAQVVQATVLQSHYNAAVNSGAVATLRLYAAKMTARGIDKAKIVSDLAELAVTKNLCTEKEKEAFIEKVLSGEKAKSAIVIGMETAVVKMNTAAQNGNRIAKLTVTAAEKLASVFGIALTAIKTTETGAVIANTEAWYANPVMWIAIVIAAAIAAIALLVTWIVKMTTGLSAGEQKLEDTKKATEAMSDAADKAKENYQTLLDTINNYDSAIEKLEGLTAGTNEFTQALLTANGYAQDLIDKYNLLSDDYFIDENGAIQFKAGVLEGAIENERENVESANAMLMGAQIEQNNAQRDSDMDKMGDGYGTATFGDGQIKLDKYGVERIYNAVMEKGFNNAAEFIQSNSMADEEKKNLISQAMYGDMYGEEYSNYEDLMHDQQEVIDDIFNNFTKGVAEYEKLLIDNKLKNEGLVKSNVINSLSDEQAYQQSDYKNYILDKILSDGQWEQAKTEASKKYENVSDDEIKTEFQNALGNNYIYEDGKVYNKDKDGKKGEENENLSNLTTDQMKDYLINADSIGLIEKHGIDLANKINIITQNLSDEEKAMSSALLNGDFTKLSKEDMTKLQDMSPDEIRAAFPFLNTLESFGIDVDTLLTEITNNIDGWEPPKIDLSKASSEFAEVHKIASDLNFGDTISEEAFLKLGEGADNYFTRMYDGTYKLTGDAQEFYDLVMGKKTDKILNDISLAQEHGKGLEENKARADASMGNMNIETIGQNQFISEELSNQNDDNYGSTNYGNLSNQIDFSAEMGTMTQEDADAYRAKFFENGGNGLTEAEIEQITLAAQNGVVAYSELTSEIDANNAAMQSSIQTIFMSTTSLDDLAMKSMQVGAAMGEAGYNYQSYADGLINLGTQYEHCSDEIEKYQQALTSIDTTQIKAAEAELKSAVAIGEMADKYNLAADEIEDYAERLQDSEEEGELSADAAAKLAVSNMRLDRGLSSLNDNLDDYKKALKDSNKGSAEWSKALTNVKNDLADVLNVADGDMLSDSFAEAILESEDLERALDGDSDAILRLRLAAADDIIANLDVDSSSLDTVQTNWNYIKGIIESENINAPGFDQTNLIASFNEMIAAGNMTKEQIEAALSGLNVSANIHTNYVGMDQDVPSSITETKTAITGSTQIKMPDGSTHDATNTITESVTYAGPTYKQKVWVPQYTIEGTEGAGGITTGMTSLPVPKASSSSISSGGGGGGKGKGGGGGGKGKGKGSGGSGAKEKPTADARSKKTDIVDRYKEINDKLEKTNRLLEKNNVEADSLWGAKRITALKNSVNLLEQENKQLKEKYELSKAYLKEDTDALHQAAADAGISFTIDDVSGNIINYTEAMTQLFNERERLLDSFGSTMSEAEDERLAEFDDKVDKVKEAYEQYEKTLDEKWDLEQEQIEKTAEIQQQYYDILSEELEMKITINDDDLKVLEYHLGKIEDDFYNMAEAAAIMIDSSSSLGMSQMDIYSNNLADYSNHLKKLEENYAAGKISQADYVEGLQDVQDNIISNLESLNDLDDAMMEYYGNTLDMAIEEIAKYTDQMDHLVSILDHYQSLMEIMGKENNYAAMGVVLEGRAKLLEDQVAVSKSTMEMLKNEATDRYQAYQEALESGNDAAAKIYLKQYEDALAAANEAEDEFLSKAEEWAESLKAILENKLKGLNKTLEEALTGGTSFDSLNTAMERAKSLQEEYLTTTNKIYETNKLMRKAQQEIDKTTNSVAKKRLQEFITETDQLQDKAKLSKFELDIQQAKYDLLLAEIALQEAQNAKSTVRLQKDSEGNFGYVYTADENLMAEAEQTLLDKQNVLYNLSLEGANEYKEKYIQTLNEMYDTLADLQQQKMDGMFASEEEYQQAVAEATQFYYEQLEQYADLHGIAITTDGRVINEAWSADFADMVQDTAVWKDAVDGYLTGAEEAFNQWADGIGKVAEAVGIPLDQIGNSIKDVTDGFAKLRDEVNNVTDESTQLKNALDGKGGIIDTVQSEITAVKSVTEKYANLREELGRVKKSYEDLMATINATIKAQANLTNASTSSASKSNSGTTSSTGKSNTNQSSSSTGNNGSTKGSNGSTKGSNGSTKGSNGSTKDNDKPKGTKVTISVSKNPHIDGSAGTMTFKNKVDRYWNNKGTQLPYSFKLNGQEYYISANSHQKLSEAGFDTGGYTGQWGPSGKWAMLHEKELVLNKKDTENFLASMDILDKIVSVIDLHSANAQLGGLLSTPQYSGFKDNQVLEQNVRIEASFPNATNHSEIEEAFNNLINTASQYANRK